RRAGGVRAPTPDRPPRPFLPGRRALAHPAQAERPGEDEPARRDHAGAAAAGGRADPGLGCSGWGNSPRKCWLKIPQASAAAGAGGEPRGTGGAGDVRGCRLASWEQPVVTLGELVMILDL